MPSPLKHISARVCVDWGGECRAPSLTSRRCKGLEELKEDTCDWSIVRPRVVQMMMENNSGDYGEEFARATWFILAEW